MKYIVLNADNSVAYTFQQTADDTRLYSAEFLDACLLLDDSVDTPRGYICDRSTKTFTAPPPWVEPEIPKPGPDITTQTQLALAELAETESAHDLENKLALAELAEMIGGTSNG